MKSRAELKQEVKDTFRGNWGSAIIMVFIPGLIFMVLEILLSVIFPAEVIDGRVYPNSISQSLSYVVSIIFAMLVTGATYQFIDWLKNKDLEFSPVKAVFVLFNAKDFWKIVGVIVIRSLFTFLWTLLFFVPGVIKSCSYSQALNLYKKAKEDGTSSEYKLTDYITQSRKLMNGHKFDYFVLQLSYIGWMLLGIITLGIGLLWVAPYVQATNAAFFNDLVKNQE
ncbi:DUF975 family protein [Companilactobacillus sp. DQM5]|uniref:DUF975 family protein n=1 Tax=Companilactobacillus sp. DQM5 TaxID=3463359 RepID=UPI00405876B5